MIANNHYIGLTTNTAAPGANKTTLFLGDLSAFCTERDIHDIFSPYGDVMEIKIMRSEETHRNLSYGFIKFASHTAAKKALNGLNGILFCGRNLRVGWASYKNKKEPKILQHHDRMDSSSVHISYISYQLNHIITEESLRILFSSFGVVLDTSIKKSYIDEGINRQCGYGFVHFSSSQVGIESALASVTGLNDVTIDNVSYKCSVSHNLEKQLMEPQRRMDVSPFLHELKSSNFRDARRRTKDNFQSSASEFGNFNLPWNNHFGHFHRDESRYPQQISLSASSNLSCLFDSIDQTIVMRCRQKFEESNFETSFGTIPRSMATSNIHGFQGTFGSCPTSDPHREMFNPLSLSYTFLKEQAKHLEATERDSLGSNDSSNSAQSFPDDNNLVLSDVMNIGFDFHRCFPTSSDGRTESF